MFALPMKVTSRTGGIVGKTIGKTRRCRTVGCTGVRIGVRWPNGGITWPCSKGMTFSNKGEAAKLV